MSLEVLNCIALFCLGGTQRGPACNCNQSATVPYLALARPLSLCLEYMSSLVSLASSSSSLARVHVANVISISNLDQIWKFTLEQMGKCFYSALCVLWIYIIHIVIDLNIITVIILISPNSFMCYQVLSDTKTPPSLSGLFTFPSQHLEYEDFFNFRCKNKLTDYGQELFNDRKEKKKKIFSYLLQNIFHISIDFGAFDI